MIKEKTNKLTILLFIVLIITTVIAATIFISTSYGESVNGLGYISPEQQQNLIIPITPEMCKTVALVELNITDVDVCNVDGNKCKCYPKPIPVPTDIRCIETNHTRRCADYYVNKIEQNSIKYHNEQLELMKALEVSNIEFEYIR